MRARCISSGRLVLMAIGTVIVMMLQFTAAGAVDTYWQVATGNWLSGSNWTAGVPGPDDMAHINNGGTANITSYAGSCGELTLGGGTGESGTVDMAGGSLEVNDYLFVGYTGTGVLHIQDGATFSNSEDISGVFIGYQAAGVGSVTVSGAGSIWNRPGSLEMRVGQDGQGSVTIQNGGEISGGSASIGTGSTGNGSIIVTGTGSTWTNAGLWVAELGVGELTIENGGVVSTAYTEIGGVPGGNGAVTVTGNGSTLSNSQYLSVGGVSTGSLTVGDSAEVSAEEASGIGVSSGSVGTVTLMDPGSSFGCQQDFVVGLNGTGTFTQTGGTHTIGNSLCIGYNSGSSGAYTISDGALSASSFFVGINGDGTLDITGTAAEITVSNLLSFGANGALAAAAGASMHMTGADFENLSTTEAELAGLANLELIFEGGPADTSDLEVACEDRGAIATGYDSNFSLGKLTVGGADVGAVRLVDNTDNGNRGGVGGNAEALYVDSLVLGAGCVLDLNNLHLYWRAGFVDNGGTILNGEVIQVQVGTIYVDDDAPNDPGPGDPTVSDPSEDGSPEHPFDAIQEGIDAANSGDEVLVLDGAYTGDGNKNLNLGGKTISVRSENGPDNCTIDCQGSGRGFRLAAGETANSVVDGFTITGGYAEHGAVVYCRNSSPTITNCVMSGNSGDYGTIWCQHGGKSDRQDRPTISNCTISGNGTTIGGGIYCYYSNPTIIKCTISDNSASYRGGGVRCWGSSPTIANCTITGNSAGDGGGVSSDGSSSPIITNCTITGNSASYGGGIYSHSSTATLSNCIVWGNQPQEVYIYSGNVAAIYSDIQGGWPGTGNIDCDPMFCYPDTGNYYLADTSCCVGAGCDSLGNPDSTVDIGAWPIGCPLPSPEVTSTSPEQNELNVPISTNISVTFDMDMDEATINDSTFVVHARSTGLHLGSITYESQTRTAMLDLTQDFEEGEVVTVVLTTEVQSSQQIPLDRSHAWSFTIMVKDGLGVFSPDSVYPSGEYPRSVFAGDLDGDADLDLVVAHSDSVSILFNHGDGTFSTDSVYRMYHNPCSAFAADLDEDGDLDLITGHSAINYVSVRLNNGDGTFASRQSYPVGDHPVSVFAADFDGDGDLDLTAANSYDDSVSVLLNYGDGTFAPETVYPAGERPESVFGADLDADGDFDLVTANNISSNVSVILNRGDGTFTPDSVYPVGLAPNAVFAADLDGDGDLDLATANSHDNVSILLNHGDATFVLDANCPAGDNPSSVFAADLDGDGDIDLVTANQQSDDLSVLLNDGAGTFAYDSVYQVGDFPRSVFAGDFDGDGDLDLASANWYSYDVSILQNYSRGDANGDGVIDLGDAIFLLNYLFKNDIPPDPLEAGDANCDGSVEIGDAIYLLNYLFKNGPPPGCP